MRKSGKQRTYKEAFLRFGATDKLPKGDPHPGCFAKRGWIFLIIKELTFLERHKRLQEIEGSRVKGGALGGVCEVCSRLHAEGYHRSVYLSMVNLSSME